MQLKCFSSFPPNTDSPKADRFSLLVRHRDNKGPQGRGASSPGAAARALLGSSQENSRVILVFPGLVIALLCYSKAENMVLLFFVP